MSGFNLKDFSLLKEDNENYTVGHPTGLSMQVSKDGLSDKARALISKLKREQHLAHSEEPVGIDDLLGPDEVIPPNNQIIPDNYYSHPERISYPEVEAPELTQTEVPQMQEEVILPQEKPEPATLNKAESSLMKAQTQLNEAGNELNKIELPEIESPVAVYERNKSLDRQFEEDYKNLPEIDQDRYWSKKSPGSKIASIIGIVLGGIGQGLIGGPNYALEMLNDAIGKDIEAQKADQSKTWNLWKMHRELSGSDLQANILSFNNQLSIAKLKAEKALNNAQNAIQKANLSQFILGINQQKDQLTKMSSLMDFNQQKGLSSQDPALLVPALVPPTQQTQVFKEIKAAENSKQMGASIMKAFDDAVKENTAFKTGAGLLRTPPSVLALHQAMLPTFADLEGSVAQAKIDATFKNITPAPGDFPETSQAKREALQEYLRSKASAPTARGYGIDLNKFRSTSPHSAEGHYRPGTKVEIKGKKYQVGADGNSLIEIK